MRNTFNDTKYIHAQLCKKVTYLMLVALIISPIFFFQSKILFAQGFKPEDNDDSGQYTDTAPAQRGFFRTMLSKVYCGITGLFFDTCQLQGSASVTGSNTDTPPAHTVITPVYTHSPSEHDHSVSGITDGATSGASGSGSEVQIVERVIERVSIPTQTTVVGASIDFVNSRIQEIANQLRFEMAARSVIVSGSGGVASTISYRQIDKIYDHTSDSINRLRAEMNNLTIPGLTGGNAGDLLRSTGSGVEWVPVSSLGIFGGGGDIDLNDLDVLAVGFNNTASGVDSTAFGNNNTASGINSSAFGFLNGRSGVTFNSVTGVVTNQGSPSTTGVSSTMVGSGNLASGVNSLAVGLSNTASIFNASAVGYVNQATGGFSSAFGSSNAASASNSTAFGYSNISSDIFTAAFGGYNTASASSASAFGNFNDASGFSSTAFGYDNTASSWHTSASGYSNTASQGSASAFGNRNTASGFNTSASGYRNTASADNSSAFGNRNFTGSGTSSVSLGLLNNSSGVTINTTTGVLSGTASAASTIGILSTAVGVNNTASGNNSSALGYLNTASGISASAVGRSNTASAGTASAFGSGNVADGLGASAFGFNNIAYGLMSSAFGSTNYVDGDNSAAFGISLSNTVDNSVKIGPGNTTAVLITNSVGSSVQFIGYGAGSLSTNGSGVITSSSDVQLKDVIGQYDGSLETLREIQPITYTWSEESGLSDGLTYVGFSAQNIRDLIPEAVNEDSRGMLSLQDRPIMALAVNAIKELDLKIDWLGDAIKKTSQGIVGFFKELTVDRLNITGEICVDDVCMSKDQFKSMMQNYGTQSGSSDSSGGGESTESEVVAEDEVGEEIVDVSDDNLEGSEIELDGGAGPKGENQPENHGIDHVDAQPEPESGSGTEPAQSTE